MITISFMALWLSRQPVPVAPKSAIIWALPACCRQLDGVIACEENCRVLLDTTSDSHWLFPPSMPDSIICGDVDIAPRGPVIVPPTP